MSGGQQQLQQLSEEIQQIQSEIEALESEIESLRAEKTEIDEAIEAVETLESGSIVQVPLGGGAYVRAEVQDIDELIVTLGGGYAAEQSSDDAVGVLENKKEALDDRIDEVNDEVAERESESEQLEREAQQMQQQAMQQLQQQQQGQGQGDQDQ